ncbi:flagellar export chaperone FliS [Paenibacillus albiflavus]|uniref:Flagellar secretion chaperone FliS n=1 Tax=Paenibacillus albiflavus TaxID=2545760 RepID=A0A4R4EFH9_9BACL|nr:flagellar export chaperone FliS [Paenibacillus albiflavus]TCZ76848.1 flagellar export chaperone FliS [Paenibacillus albiflavus]
MLQANPNKYLETAVQTASPGQLLLMLYDGVIRSCKQSIKYLEIMDYPNANKSLLKAQRIISELRVTLDNKYPISQELYSIYEYFGFRLIQANLKKDAAQVEEVLAYFIELKEAWIEASKIANTQGAKANG